MQVPYRAEQAEQVLVFGLIFQALVPLTALIFAAGMVQDDVEEQTLTYLLVRPIPRWMIYFCKLLATFLVALLRGVVFTTATLVLIYWGDPALWKTVIPGRALMTSALLALSLLAYVTIFGFLSLWVRRTLVVGAIYIVVLRGRARQHRLRFSLCDGDVFYPGVERAMAGSAGHGLVDRSGSGSCGFDLFDRTAGDQRRFLPFWER